MIYLSTGYFQNKKPFEVLEEFSGLEHQNFEISGGIFDPAMVANLHKYIGTTNITLHNYVPASTVPFTFNLASENPQISKMSMDMAKRNVYLSHLIGAKLYSFHAGSCF